MNRARLVFNSAIDPAWLVILALILFGLAVWCYARASPRPAWTRVAALVTLRSLAILCALFALAGPEVRTTELVSERLRLAVLLDESRSMSIADARGGLSRADHAAALFKKSADVFKGLENDFNLAYYSFDRVLRPQSAPHFEPSGSFTALGSALADTLATSAQEKLGAVLLVSDGISNADAPVETALSSFVATKVPIFAFAVGGQMGGGRLPEAAVLALRAPKRAVLSDEMAVEADLRLTGAKGMAVSVALLVDGVEAAKKEYRPESDDVKMTERFSYVPTTEGLRRFTVRVQPLKGEAVELNNQQSTYVSVVKGGIRVLILEGSFRPELTFLRRSLEGAPELVSSLALVLPGSRAVQNLPKTAEGWRRFDVVLIGDLASTSFPAESMKALSDAVSAGTGVGILGGLRNFGTEGFQSTPLEPLFPVALSDSDAFRSEAYLLRPTDAGKASPILRFRSPQTPAEKFWAEGARLSGYVKAGAPKTGATVLAEGPKQVPVLVIQRYGTGRVAAMLTDSTWRWVLSPSDFSEFHRRLWRQFILYLAGRDTEPGKSVWMELASYNFDAGQRAAVRLFALDDKGQPLKQAEITADARSGLGGAQPVRFLPAPGYFLADLSEFAPGDYTLNAEVRENGSSFGKAETRFIVNEPMTEFLRIEPNRELMKRLAAATGGAYAEGDDLQSLLTQIRAVKGVYKYSREVTRSLWDSAAVFCLFLAFLSVEWALRRRWGLA